MAARADRAGAPARPRLPGLGARLIAATLFVPCFTLITWRGGPYFVVLVTYVTLAGAYEFHRFLAAKGIRGQKGTAAVGAVALPWLAYLQDGTFLGLGLVLLVLASMATELRRPAVEALVRSAASVLGVLYVSWLGSHLVLLRQLPGRVEREDGVGFVLVILLFSLVWLSDTGAYAVGSIAGRHKLAPRISPGKSLEGAIGGLVFAVGAGTAAALTFARGEISPAAGAALGALASVVGQTGDLVESQIKRDAQVKDASDVIPGHGGALDRFDSVLFAAPLVYYALRFLVY